MDNINTRWREKFKKRYILLFLFFVFGAYAFMTSVLTRGQIQETPESVQVITENGIKSEPKAPPLVPQVLGDKDFAVDWNVRGTKANTNGLFGNRLESYDQFLDKNTSEITVKDGEIKLIPSDAPKIVLGYKEGFNEAWDVCDNLSLAQSFGFNTADCQVDDQAYTEPEQIAYNRGGGGFSGENIIEDPVVGPENEEPEQEPEEDPVVYASSSQAILMSFKIGSQEVMGKRGSEAMSRTEISYKAGAMFEVFDPYHFTGVELEASSSSTIMVYIYQDGGGWSTWDLNYPGAMNDLASIVLSNKATVLVKVISEDFSTTNWYKAKVFDPNNLAQIPNFLTTFKVGGLNVLPLVGLTMDHHVMNSVDFGANLLVSDFNNFKGVEVAVDDWDSFVEAEVLIYHDGWSTWDLKYDGALEDLATVSLNEGEMIILRLQDQENNSFWYRVNLVKSQEEIVPVVTNEEEVLNSDSSLKDLLIGDHSIDLEVAHVGPVWSPDLTGAVLTVDSFEGLVGVMPQASDYQNAQIKVKIFRDYWITWEYEVGLDMVAKEQISPNDRIVIEVTAEDDTQTYYQVQVTLKTEVENPPIQASPESVSADEAIKPEQTEELKPENTDNDQPEPDVKKEVEKIAEEISTDNVKIE